MNAMRARRGSGLLLVCGVALAALACSSRGADAPPAAVAAIPPPPRGELLSVLTFPVLPDDTGPPFQDVFVAFDRAGNLFVAFPYGGNASIRSTPLPPSAGGSDLALVKLTDSRSAKQRSRTRAENRSS